MANAMKASTMSVSYKSLPHKDQLLILMLSRFTEPLTTSSIQSYLFFQLQHFDPSATAATISRQAGVIVGCKTAAHVCTGMVWGALADRSSIGRKNVLVTGLLATSVATLGYGFSKTFAQALMWQMLDGALNATIAMVRCMIAELNPEKSYRVRALTLLPLCANVGSLLGPLVGGFLAASKTSPSLISSHPYAAPNICVASIQGVVAIIVMLFLKETMNDERLSAFESANKQQSKAHKQSAIERVDSLASSSDGPSEISPLLATTPMDDETPQILQETQSHASLPFRRMWTPNVLSTLLAQFIISGHLGTFASLWAIFLSMPVKLLPYQHPPIHFTGGIGLQPRSVGVAMSAFGFAGIVLQIAIYPTVQDRWGTIRVWRGALCIFPVVYVIAPFCALVASAEESSAPVWLAILFVLVLFATGRTGVVPATSLLINDCTPHPSVRAKIHTAGVIVSNLSKSVFPPMAFAVLGYGISVGAVGLSFWFVAGLALLSCISSLWVWEGTNGRSECGPLER
ncbi:major facilitator superfamily domain-containing protein [Lophiotrema nucula]|uniref:Major facilitator superfamily domain-containing protein n=1 Tax=Lophiotrema nucula TaxID=690887 RepID=A0A6A5YRM2_9PLEO|nr:major facilitator superfamily domain-containing protein [Lophiotrema nucula]